MIWQSEKALGSNTAYHAQSTSSNSTDPTQIEDFKLHFWYFPFPHAQADLIAKLLQLAELLHSMHVLIWGWITTLLIGWALPPSLVQAPTNITESLRCQTPPPFLSLHCNPFTHRQLVFLSLNRFGSFRGGDLGESYLQAFWVSRVQRGCRTLRRDILFAQVWLMIIPFCTWGTTLLQANIMRKS